MLQGGLISSEICWLDPAKKSREVALRRAISARFHRVLAIRSSVVLRCPYRILCCFRK
jgi:hypothetical protein